MDYDSTAETAPARERTLVERLGDLERELRDSREREEKDRARIERLERQMVYVFGDEPKVVQRY